MNADPTSSKGEPAEPDYRNLPERYRQPPDLAALIDVVDAEPSHRPLIAELTVRAYEPVQPDLYSSGDHVILSDVAGREEAGHVLAARFDGFVVGAVTFVPDRTSPLHGFDDEQAASFDHLAVDTSSQRLGIGRALVQACVDRAAEMGAARLLVRCREPMAAARHLLESTGFVAVEPPYQTLSNSDGTAYRLEL